MINIDFSMRQLGLFPIPQVLAGVRSLSSSAVMAKSKYEYVKRFEVVDACLPNTWMVVRLDGRSFTKFTSEHAMTKPNDERGLRLMNTCAGAVMREFSDLVLAYGQSDEFSFILKRESNLFSRRASKIMTTISSFFSACYVFHWSSYFPDTPLLYPPTFDGRVVLYPTPTNLRDYLSWRQADCHINNLYNTCFWALVHSGQSTVEAQAKLSGTVSSDKNELLFSQFGVNYNKIPAMFRKGSVLFWSYIPKETVSKSEQEVLSVSNSSEASESVSQPRTVQASVSVCKTGKKKRTLSTFHCDIIGDEFWQENCDILGAE